MATLIDASDSSFIAAPASEAAACPQNAGPSLYEIKGACVEAAGQVLLQPLDLSLQAGQMTALIGHNGSCKSTLLKLLSHQLTPTRGKLHFKGMDLSAWPIRRFAQQVAYLPQHPPAHTGMTVRELVSLGRYPWHGALGRWRAEDHAKVDEALHLTHTAHFAEQLTDHLSGGERQRAWLAMMIAQGASCLLLDEPTSALDLAHQIEMLRLLRELTDSQPELTTIIVLHDINLAARFCDRLIALRHGHLLMSGTPDELMDGDKLEQIYGIPMDILLHPHHGYRLGIAR